MRQRDEVAAQPWRADAGRRYFLATIRPGLTPG